MAKCVEYGDTPGGQAWRRWGTNSEGQRMKRKPERTLCDSGRSVAHTEKGQASKDLHTVRADKV